MTDAPVVTSLLGLADQPLVCGLGHKLGVSVGDPLVCDVRMHELLLNSVLALD
jgi:hypothetical protein